MGLTIEVEGLQAFINKIDDDKEVRKSLNIGIKKIVFFLEGEAKVFTPVDKGFLRNSFRQTYGDLMGKVFTTRKYASAVHEGHTQTPGRYVPALGVRLVKSFVKGNPFMTKAVKKSKKEVNLIMNEELLKHLSILK